VDLKKLEIISKITSFAKLLPGLHVQHTVDLLEDWLFASQSELFEVFKKL